MAGAQELKLLGAVSGVSPYVIRAQMALGVKGLSYEYLPENLARKSELLLRCNPVHKQVPVLIHNGRSICDSSIIVQYIDEVFTGNGYSILPFDPYERAIARFWAAYIDDKLFPSCISILKGKTEEEKIEKTKEAFDAFQLLEEVFSGCSKGKAFFGGDNVGYLDIALGCFLCWFQGIGDMAGTTLLDAARMPKLAAWAENFKATEIVGSLIPGTDKVETYVNMVLYPKWNASAAGSNN